MPAPLRCAGAQWRTADRLGHTLLLAHFSDDRLGIFSIAAMIAFSPSMFPSQQMSLLAKL